MMGLHGRLDSVKRQPPHASKCTGEEALVINPDDIRELSQKEKIKYANYTVKFLKQFCLDTSTVEFNRMVDTFKCRRDFDNYRTRRIKNEL